VHTNGLENFSLIWGAQAVNVSVNSTDHSVTESLQKQHQDEVTLAKDSAYWIDVQVPSQADVPYRLTAPSAFLEDAPALWGLAWVDFYR